MRLRGVAVVALVAAIAFTSCLDDVKAFLSDYDPTDLTMSADPAEKAAGSAAVVDKKEEQAQSLVETAILDGSAEKLADAVKLRPADPRYPIYQAIQEDKPSHLATALGIIQENNPTKGPDERLRLFIESW